MSMRVNRLLFGAAVLGALVFACTSPVNEDVVIRGRSETPAFGTDGGTSPVAPDAELGPGMCPSNECPAGRISCPDHPFPCGVDLMNDDNNCGACGVRCPWDDEFLIRFFGTTHCVRGTCKLTCVTGYADCNGLLDDGCEVQDLFMNNKNCGACGVTCKENEACSQGTCVCEGTSCPCPPGQTRCDDGQCHKLKTENNNCGACGNVCPPSTDPPFPDDWHMTRTCGDGKCNQPSCKQGWYDCNGDSKQPNGDGCEIDILNDEANCGTCGYKCAPGEVCQRGRCECPCGQSCFTAINSDIENCGSCGFRCPGWGVGGNAVCSQGVCDFECLVNHADCDHDLNTGCEVDLLRDPMNCGACGVRCDGIEGQACIDGRCLMKECTVK